jgi:hypothetical protein
LLCNHIYFCEKREKERKKKKSVEFIFFFLSTDFNKKKALEIKKKQPDASLVCGFIIFSSLIDM